MELAMSGQARARAIESWRERHVQQPVLDVLSVLGLRRAQEWAEQQQFQILRRNLTNALLSGRW